MGLVERCSSVVAAAIAATPGRRNTRRNAHTAAMARVNQEAMELRRTLLVVCVNSVLTCYPMIPVLVPFSLIIDHAIL